MTKTKSCSATGWGENHVFVVHVWTTNTDELGGLPRGRRVVEQHVLAVRRARAQRRKPAADESANGVVTPPGGRVWGAPSRIRPLLHGEYESCRRREAEHGEEDRLRPVGEYVGVKRCGRRPRSWVMWCGVRSCRRTSPAKVVRTCEGRRIARKRVDGPEATRDAQDSQHVRL